jgi:hypothetical protein
MGNRHGHHHQEAHAPDAHPHHHAQVPQKVRGALGAEEFLLLHNAVQHYMLDVEQVNKRVNASTPIGHDAFCKCVCRASTQLQTAASPSLAFVFTPPAALPTCSRSATSLASAFNSPPATD